MNLMEFGTYLCNGIVALALGVALMCYQTSEKVTRDYNRARRYLAYCNFIGAATDAIAVTIITYGHSAHMLKTFLVPAVYYAQVGLAAFALLSIVRSERSNFRNSMLFATPLIAILLAYTVVLFSAPEFDMTLSGYSAFCATRQSRFLSISLRVALLVESAVLLYWTTSDTVEYCKRANATLSGTANIKARRASRLTMMLWGYFVIAIINSLPLPTAAKIILMWLSIAMFVGSTIMAINFSSSFVIVEKEMEAEEKAEKKTTIKTSNTLNTNKEDKQSPTKPTMDTLIENWKRNAKKQYLKEGITLSAVAHKIGVSPRLLSEYLNNVKGMNFNTWINSMRIDEVKAEIEKSPATPLVEIAQKAGFTDSSAMTKVFKRFTGMTPTQYRNETAPQSTEEE